LDTLTSQSVPFCPVWPKRDGGRARHTTPAAGAVRPGLRVLHEEVRDSAFAAGVDRERVRSSGEIIGLDLDEHLANVIAAMREIRRRSACGPLQSVGRAMTGGRRAPMRIGWSLYYLVMHRRRRSKGGGGYACP